MQKTRDEQGMTLIEVVVAMVVFTIGVLGIIALQLNAVRVNAETRQRDEANRILAAHAERVGMSSYADLINRRSNNLGTGAQVESWKSKLFLNDALGDSMVTGAPRYDLSRFVVGNTDNTKTVYFCLRWQGRNQEERMFRTVLKGPDREG